MLLQNQGEQNLFAIVNHFNCGLNLIKDELKKIEVANLSLKAAQKAKASNAYQEALTFANTGISLLPPNSWNDLYPLTFQLNKEAAENMMLLKKMEEAETYFFELIKASKNILDKSDIYYLLMTLYSVDAQDKALSYGIEILEELGIYFPKKLSNLHILLQLIKLQTRISFTPKEKLINLPTITSPKLLRIAEIFSRCLYCSTFCNPLFYKFGILKDTEFHLRYGFSEHIFTSFLAYSTVIINKFHAFKLGKYWIDNVVNSYLSRMKREPTAYSLISCWTINHWYLPIHTIVTMTKKGMQIAIENGDLQQYYSFCVYYSNLFYIGTPLEEVLNASHISALEGSKALGYYYLSQNCMYIINILLGKELYDQSKVDYFIKSINNKVILEIALIYAYLFSYFYMTENYDEAYQYIKKIELVEESIIVLPAFIYSQAMKGLILTALYKNMSSSQRFSVRRQLKKIRKFLKIASDQQSYNFSPYYYLISAEIDSLGNNLEKTIDHYNQAVSFSLTSENWLFAALSNECAAKFLLRMEQPKLAKSYMQEARYYYTRWGALAKVKLLEDKYPQWFKEEREETTLVDTMSSTTARTGNLDYLSIIKSTQVLSSEIILSKLLEKLMRILLENAGAQRGLLMIEREGQMFIEAEGLSTQEEVLIKDETIDERADIPLALISYVQRTKESVVLADASKDIKFSQDPYIKKIGLKSAICSPILYQNKVMGFIYLENNATENAFTKERIEVLNILSSQAAISLENARLYVSSGKFVPIEFLQLLKKRSLVDVRLGDHIENKMSVLFLDIRGFTMLSETMSASENFEFINSFLAHMEPVIRYYDGFIDKFIGDAIMALFKGAKADDALQAAIGMLGQLKEFNQELANQNRPPIRIGIGINTGDLILGIVGGKQRMESSVIGDTVNIASHMESLTKQYGVQLLISEETKNSLTDTSEYTFRLIDKVSVKGKKQLINIWEVLYRT